MNRMIIVCSIVLSAFYAQAQSIIANGGFETAGTNGLPAQWRCWMNNPAPKGCSFELTASPVSEGKQSLKIVDTLTNNSFGIESLFVPAEAGKSYKASAAIFTESGSLNIYIQFFDKAGKRVGAQSAGPKGTGVWENVSVTLTAPADTASVNVLCYSANATTGAGYFDAAKIEVLP